jgi:hypothetical protein
MLSAARHAQVGEIREEVTSRKQAIAIGLSRRAAPPANAFLVEEAGASLAASPNSRRRTARATLDDDPASSVTPPSVW